MKIGCFSSRAVVYFIMNHSPQYGSFMFMGWDVQDKMHKEMDEKWKELVEKQIAEYMSLTTPEFREYDKKLEANYWKDKSTYSQLYMQPLADRIADFNSTKNR